jgi:phosphatidylglycerophosphate synthase
LLYIVGECEERIFGLRPPERLERQLKGRGEVELVAHASAVMDDAALGWLVENRGTIIASASGRPLAVAVEPGQVDDARQAIAGGVSAFPVIVPQGEQFVRKLRRRVEVEAHCLLEQPVQAMEKRMFADVYKGVTDLVTKYAWPWPALHVTRAAARLGFTPNMVTFAGLVLVFVAGWLFYEGDLAAGLAAAWLMTFFDTVDGKLARVTVTSSWFGNILDHGTDIIHPPIWWYCLARGLVLHEPAQAPVIWPAFWIILGTYILGRAVENLFKWKLGINQFIWRPFDSRFRLIVSRRNIILLIMTAGLAAGMAAEAFVVCAAWSIISTLLQLVRLGQAAIERRRAPITSWLY